MFPLASISARSATNWELVYCELYAGGKYHTNQGQNYEYSLGLNGLGACATQFSSEYMDVTVYRDGKKYTLHFERGLNIGGLQAEDFGGRRTGTITHWKPDRAVLPILMWAGPFLNLFCKSRRW